MKNIKNWFKKKAVLPVKDTHTLFSEVLLQKNLDQEKKIVGLIGEIARFKNSVPGAANFIDTSNKDFIGDYVQITIPGQVFTMREVDLVDFRRRTKQLGILISGVSYPCNKVAEKDIQTALDASFGKIESYQ